MQSYTVFNTPVIAPIVRCCLKLAQTAFGWRVEGQRADLDKCVYIAAPHTSNWDFPLMLAVCFTAGIEARWIGKHTLFRWPFAWIMLWLGGISIDRRKAGNVVEQLREQYEHRDKLELIIAPEGTRSKVKEWKSGFYRIAIAANVPVVMAAVHAPAKVVLLSRPYYPTGDYDSDMVEINRFYAGKTGIRPDQT